MERLTRSVFLAITGEEGVEPPTDWLKTRCSSQLSYSPIVVVDEDGLEPTTF